MSDTPRTDATEKQFGFYNAAAYGTLARVLERDLAAANDEIRRLREAAEILTGGMEAFTLLGSHNAATALLEERVRKYAQKKLDKYREATALPPLVTANLLKSEGEQAISEMHNRLLANAGQDS